MSNSVRSKRPDEVTLEPIRGALEKYANGDWGRFKRLALQLTAEFGGKLDSYERAITRFRNVRGMRQFANRDMVERICICLDIDPGGLYGKEW